MKTLVFWVLMFASALPALTQDFPMGCAFDEAAHAKIPKSSPLLSRSYSTIPSRASVKDFAPTPQSQAPFNTCVGWSTSYACRTILHSAKMGVYDRESIDANAFSSSFIYNQVRLADGCMGGTYIHDGLDVLVNTGSLPLSDFPNECDREVSSADKQKASAFKITDYKALVPSRGISLTHLMRKSVSEKKPVVVSIKCFDSFMKIRGESVWSGNKDVFYGHHAIVVVGYDNKKFGGAFEVMNSWGTLWGNEGFAWIKYGDMESICAGAYELVDDLTNYKTVEEDYNLAGKVRFERLTGGDMKADLNGTNYNMREAYGSGTQFRMYISNEAPAYVYVFGSDLSENTSLLFPISRDWSAVLNYKNNEVALPSEHTYIEMDNRPGRDYLCVLFSKKPLPILDILRSVQRSDGNFQQKVKSVLGDRLLSQDKVVYEKGGRIGFKAIVESKDLVALTVEVEHK